MTKRILYLSNDIVRKRAEEAIRMAPPNWRITIEPPRRSLAQNDRLWALLTDIAEQVVWHGRKLDAESWKHVFSSALKKQDIVPNLDGTGFVVLGVSTSRMSTKEHSDLMELTTAFGNERGVEWSDQPGNTAAPRHAA